MDDECQTKDHSVSIARHVLAPKQAQADLYVCHSARSCPIEGRTNVRRGYEDHAMPGRTPVLPCRKRSKKPDDQTQKIHQIFFLATMFGYKEALDKLAISSPGVYRDQLFMNFTNAHFPVDLPSRYVVLPKLSDWFSPRSPAMAAALDCLLLVQFAADTGHEGCKIEAKKRHQAAIQHLRRELQKPNAATDDGILGAIDALCIGEMYAEISQGADVWKHHARGMCKLVKARGPQSINTPFARDVIIDSLHVALMDAIIARKAFIFGDKEWLDYTAQFKNRRMCHLLNIGCRIPTLLERVDRVAQENNIDPRDMTDLLRELKDVELRLSNWLLDWYKARDNVLQYWPVSITQFPKFVHQYGALAHVFPLAFKFRSILDAFGHIYFWTLLLPVREAICDVAKHPQAPFLQSSAHLVAAANECAYALCQSVPYKSSESPKCTCGVLATCGPLMFAAQWFDKQNDQQRANWCRTICETLDRGQAHVAELRKSVCLPRAFAGWMAVAF
ncbi:hypothetical protein M433DRAFT_528070 [Acidomyces richmondensis BFW]|nr:MAG: hypothetical protein FE78DRAFT_332168 [Acidomyces sp. 'richmondensis']KYG46930.1 hypothetical protein M433DRAFT_528070 [Acidomyces richmondensis BFW]